MVAKIFISYRRDDSADASGRLYDRLVAQFGEANVFKDVDNIPLGVDFRTVLTGAVGQCAAMLVVIGRQWLGATDEGGRPRLELPGDFVRIEIEEALARDIPVIPVLVQNASMPQEHELPPSLAPLAYRNGLGVRADPYFHGDVTLLINRLTPLVGESAADLLARGKALLVQKSYAEAQAVFERATQMAPTSAEAWANLGRALNYLTRLPEGLAACERALALDPALAIAWTGKGYALDGLKRPLQEQLDAYEHATALDPANAIAWSNKGVTLRALGRYAEALLAYDRALALAPNDAVAWTNKGNVLHELQRYAEALLAYDRATSLDPTSAAAWRNEAYPLRALGRVAEAEAAERRAKELGLSG